MQNILVRLSNVSTTASSGCVVTPRVQRTTRSRPANEDDIGLASSDAPTPTRSRFRRPAAQITAPTLATVELHDSAPSTPAPANPVVDAPAPTTPGMLFGSQLAEATQAPATPTISTHAGFDSRLTAGEFMEVLAVQRPVEPTPNIEAAEEIDDPDVDVTGYPGDETIATGQASAAVESAPDISAGTYLAFPPGCRPTVPLTVP